MATVAQLLSSVASKVESDLGPSRLDDDYRDDLSQVAAGTFRYQLRGTKIGDAALSNTGLERAQIAVELIYKLSDGQSERAWTEGSLLTHKGKITDRSWWNAIAEVYEFESLEGTLPERSGRIITDTVTATVIVQP